MGSRIIGLAIKEFLALLRDPKGRLVLVVPPLVQLVVFGYAATYDLNRVPWALLNEDRGALSRQLVARFEGSPVFLRSSDLESPMQVGPELSEKRALMVLHIGPHFSRDLLLGRPAQVQILVDGRNSNVALLALGYARTILDDFSRSWAAAQDASTPPAPLEMRAWFNENLESRWFFVPGIVALLTLVVTMLVTALSVAREREAGTFDQLLVTPLRPVEILIGKSLPGVVIGLVEATVISLAAVLWFRVPLRGSLAALYLGLLLFLLGSIGVGLLISSLVATQQQALLGTFLFLVPSVLLSGFATPVANMPPILQTATRLNPMRYFLVIVRRVFLEGAGVHELLAQYWPMLAIGVMTLTVAGRMFRRRMY